MMRNYIYNYELPATRDRIKRERLKTVDSEAFYWE